MKLVWRRAREARGLLVAAVIAALVAVALVTGLSDYNRRAVDAGQRALVAASPAEERGLLVSGPGGRDAAEFATRDQAVRAEFADGLDGVPVTVAAARFGTGRELTGDLGAVPRAGDEPIFANLATLDDLAGHAELTSGAWPRPGANPVQVSLPERVATALGLTVGERIPLRDRASERAGAVVLAGTWRPRDATEAYWLLAPGVGAGSAGSATSYGPFALDPADFAATFPGSVTASWLAEPDLGGVDAAELPAVRAAVTAASTAAPEAAQLGSSASGRDQDRPAARPDRPRRPGGPVRAGHPAAADPGARRVRAGACRRPAARGPPAADRAAARPRRRPPAVRRPGRPRGDPGGRPGGPARAGDRRGGAAVRPTRWFGGTVHRRGQHHPDLGGRRGDRGRLPRGHGRADAARRRHVRGRHGRPVAAEPRRRASSGPVSTWCWSRSPCSRGCSCAGTPHRWPARTAGSASTRCWSPPRRSACWPAPCWRCGCSRRSPASPSGSSTGGPWTATMLRHVAGRPASARRTGAAARPRRRRQHPGLVADQHRRAVPGRAGRPHGRRRPAGDRAGRFRPVDPGRPARRAAGRAPGTCRRGATRYGSAGRTLPVTVIGFDPRQRRRRGPASPTGSATSRWSTQYQRMAAARGAPAGVELPAGTRALTGTVRTPVGQAVRPAPDRGGAAGHQRRRAGLPAAGGQRRQRRTGRAGSPCTCRTWARRGCGWPASRPTAGRRPATRTGSRWTACTLVGADGATRPAELTGDWVTATWPPGDRRPGTAQGAVHRLPASPPSHPVEVIPGGQFAYQPPTRFAIVPAGQAAPVPVLMTAGGT